MPDRTRTIRKKVCLNEQELNRIRHKMNRLGTHNFGAYALKMLIDGYIIEEGQREFADWKAQQEKKEYTVSAPKTAA